MTRPLELLAPAKNLECGIAAIDHGADAVYIGATRFGARAAAGNSVADIAELCIYAHRYGAKVYVTVNTIVYDHELDETRRLLQDLADAGADAILVQDMALLTPQMALDRSRLSLHASTQTDNRTADKVAWLHSMGFSRVVLARELSADEIAAIHREVPDVELEVFVHGALCVSYSGLCYASQYCFGRSANRGECAQFCRMKFNLVDAEGREWQHQRHLLSLKDLCQADALEQLADAGATSFKIEGRLKDIGYVKNVTAAYRQQLDTLISRHPDRYCRSSLGTTAYTFRPELHKTFNRGFTHYFLHGRQPDIWSPDTPKALGEYVGKVKELRGNSLSVAGIASFANGDGLCFINDRHELEGFRVNRAEGGRLYPQHMPQSLRPGTPLYRNNDQAFERILSGKTAERRIGVTMRIEATDDGFRLYIGHVHADINAPHQLAEKPQRDNIVRQLIKLGGTPYTCSEVDMAPDFNFFIPSSRLVELRRKAVEALQSQPSQQSQPPLKSQHPLKPQSPPPYSPSFQYNIANRLAREFYSLHGLADADAAFEVKPPRDKALIMQCRHCLRYALGYCVKHGGRKAPWREPLQLELADGRRFPIAFDCQHCQMNIYAPGR